MGHYTEHELASFHFALARLSESATHPRRPPSHRPEALARLEELRDALIDLVREAKIRPSGIGGPIRLMPPILRERDDPPRARIPEDEPQCVANLRQAQPGHVLEEPLVLVVAFHQAIIRDSRREMMDVVIAD